MRPIRMLGLLLLIFVLFGSCSAQDCSSVVVPLNVFTKEGKVVQGVMADRLLVRVHGKHAKITAFTLDTTPRRAVLLLDTRGSMAGLNRTDWRFVPELGAYALSTIPNDASIAVGTISKPPHVGEFGSRAQAEARIRMLTPDSFYGMAPLLDSIHAALLRLGGGRFGDVLYVVTSGKYYLGRVTEDQLEREALRGTRIFLLMTGPKDPVLIEQELRSQWLSEFANDSGGRVLHVPPVGGDPVPTSELIKIAPLIQSQIASTYRMVVVSARPIKKLAAIDVRYTGPDEKLAKSFHWLYPHLIGCAPHR